jgi:predicted AAA+ superfamily ATPase
MKMLHATGYNSIKDQRAFKKALRHQDDKSIILNGPVGVAKTFYATLLIKKLKDKGNANARFDEQVFRTFGLSDY